MADDAITISRAYFDTLLRRAAFDIDAQPRPLRPSWQTIIEIPQTEYEALLQIGREYEALKEALYQGGASQHTLNILIRNGLARQQEPIVQKQFNPMALPFKHTDTTKAPESPRKMPAYPAIEPVVSTWADGVVKTPSTPKTSFGNTTSDDLTEFESAGEWQVCKADKNPSTSNKKRTLLLYNLSDKVIHKDIVGVVRGGVILDIYMRTAEKSALVSFLDPIAAQAFLRHARRDKLSLYGKRVDVAYAERDFNPSANVMRQVTGGATRNIVIRCIGEEIDEDRIRQDLEHIHGLVTIDVTISNGDATVRLNAIHLALFARTCLRSQTAYRKCTIQFVPDECAAPLPITDFRNTENKKKPLKSKPASPRRPQTVANRFQMLSVDGNGDSSDDSQIESISSHGTQTSTEMDESTIIA